MTPFRREFRLAFGLDFPGEAIELPLPRVRFALLDDSACSTTIDSAIERCCSIFEAAFGAIDEVWIELQFHPWLRSPDPTDSIEVLESYGLRPAMPSDWTADLVRHGDGDEHRYSARIPVGSPGLKTLFRAICLADHGTWEQITPSALFFSTVPAVGYWPYDDRGADLFARRPESLKCVSSLPRSWILESNFASSDGGES